jgi:hypothetical protein
VEQAGFDFAAISDHFLPWFEEQGHASFAWSVLGALANAIERLGLMTAVTCPIMRYHPAIIAQAAATLALLSKNRFSRPRVERTPQRTCRGCGFAGPARAPRTLHGSGRHHPRSSDRKVKRLIKHLQPDHARLFDRRTTKLAVVIAAGASQALATTTSFWCKSVRGGPHIAMRGLALVWLPRL